MRDYSKMFLGLILAGVVLIVIGLWLVGSQARNNEQGQPRPALSARPLEGGPKNLANAKNR